MSGVFGLACSRPPGHAILPILTGMGEAMSHQPWHRVDLECDDTAPVALGRVGIGGINPGVQPATESQKRVSLFMAGEFYYRERLLQTLDAGQRPSQEDDDASLALRLYLAHGADFAESVEGMFSIAVWDRGTASSSSSTTASDWCPPTTRSTKAGWSSRRKSKPCFVRRDLPPARMKRRWPNSCATSSCWARRRSSRASRSFLRRLSCALTRGPRHFRGAPTGTGQG